MASTSKIVSGILAAAVTSYFMNWCSLRGVDFKILGVDSEIVKSSLIGTLSGIFIGFTPHNFVQSVVAAILFIRGSWRKIEDAATTKNLPDEEQK